MNLIQNNDLASGHSYPRKNLILSGVEIFFSDNEDWAKKFLDFTGQVICLLESNLDFNGEPFDLKITIDHAPNKSAYKTIFLSGSFNQETEDQVLRIVQESANMLDGCDGGKAIARINVTDG